MKGAQGGTWPWQGRSQWWQRQDHKRARRAKLDEVWPQMEDQMDAADEEIEQNRLDDEAELAAAGYVRGEDGRYTRAVGSVEVPEVAPEIASDGAVTGVAPFVPERWREIAQQAFHDALCERTDFHYRPACSRAGGPIEDAADAAVAAVLKALLAEVDEEMDRRQNLMFFDPEAAIVFLAGGLHGLLYARHLILRGERLTSKDDDE